MTDGRPRVLVLQGPNLNLLGAREPDVYGSGTLAELTAALDVLAGTLGIELVHTQSNLEGELVQAVQDAAAQNLVGAVVNAGGYTHTSVALRDALIASNLPFVEVHLSNVAAREPFRHTSVLADRAVGVVGGFGPRSYALGLRGLVDHLGLARR